MIDGPLSLRRGCPSTPPAYREIAMAGWRKAIRHDTIVYSLTSGTVKASFTVPALLRSTLNLKLSWIPSKVRRYLRATMKSAA